jgi:hypothetical protein
MDNSDGLELPPRPAQNSPERQNTGRKSSNANTDAREIKKRNRIPVSCNECRRRKLRYHFLKTVTHSDVIGRNPARHVFSEAMPTHVDSLNLSLQTRTSLIHESDEENPELPNLDREISYNKESIVLNH